MAQKIKALTAVTDDLSSSPGTHGKRRELIPESCPVCSQVCTYQGKQPSLMYGLRLQLLPRSDSSVCPLVVGLSPGSVWEVDIEGRKIQSARAGIAVCELTAFGPLPSSAPITHILGFSLTQMCLSPPSSRPVHTLLLSRSLSTDILLLFYPLGLS